MVSVKNQTFSQNHKQGNSWTIKGKGFVLVCDVVVGSFWQMRWVWERLCKLWALHGSIVASFPLLVICPASLQKVWQRQVARWLKIPVLDIVIPFYSGTRYSPPKVVIVSYAALQDMEQIYGVNAMLYKASGSQSFALSVIR